MAIDLAFIKLKIVKININNKHEVPIKKLFMLKINPVIKPKFKIKKLKKPTPNPSKAINLNIGKVVVFV